MGRTLKNGGSIKLMNKMFTNILGIEKVKKLRKLGK